ncbi:hypothetical protein M1M34_gp125 [Haloarcula tailed virus 2]|uniref:Uncharacterized protein n=1 Tax=Haloarcula tailed virus 2 TaxID=2877989 RepID=A0AAE9BZA1_9CAUD|nr:hypothetical protein M1M34_gp125 [Haloarcula tailed virus 2]UBF23208.1 hypothetical protein HATV-2_gp57 [Haloarcula tailed virus 2]
MRILAGSSCRSLGRTSTTLPMGVGCYTSTLSRRNREVAYRDADTARVEVRNERGCKPRDSRCISCLTDFYATTMTLDGRRSRFPFTETLIPL